jgi:hypothetical protein
MTETKSKRIQDQAIYTKIYDLALWLIPHVGKYPKSERMIIGNQTKQCLLDLLKNVVLAYGKALKLPHLQEASAQLDLLRLLIRLSVDLRYTSIKQYEYVSNLVNEVGRMLGGWLASRREEGG